MRVLHIIDTLSVGGAQSLVKGIMERQSTNLNLYCYNLRQTAEPISIAHSQVSNFEGSSKLSLTPLFEIKQLVSDNQIEVLHCHLFRSQIFGWILIKFWFRDCRLIFHEHGQIVGSDDGNILVDFLYKLFLKVARKEVFRFIAISNAVRLRLDELSLNSSISVVYNFIDLERFNLEKGECNDEIIETLSSEKKEEDFTIGFAGRLIGRKGWQEFLKATFSLMSAYPNIHILIAGGGPDREKVIDYIQGQQKAYYCGQVKDMRSYYQLLDCFVIPSHWEPMGLTQLEAAACGVPVVASNVEGLNETIIDDENGLLFEAGNETDLAEKIERLYDDEEMRERLVDQGLIHVKRFSLDLYLDQLSKVYQD